MKNVNDIIKDFLNEEFNEYFYQPKPVVLEASNDKDSDEYFIKEIKPLLTKAAFNKELKPIGWSIRGSGTYDKKDKQMIYILDPPKGSKELATEMVIAGSYMTSNDGMWSVFINGRSKGTHQDRDNLTWNPKKDANAILKTIPELIKDLFRVRESVKIKSDSLDEKKNEVISFNFKKIVQDVVKAFDGKIIYHSDKNEVLGTEFYDILIKSPNGLKYVLDLTSYIDDKETLQLKGSLKRDGLMQADIIDTISVVNIVDSLKKTFKLLEKNIKNLNYDDDERIKLIEKYVVDFYKGRMKTRNYDILWFKYMPVKIVKELINKRFLDIKNQDLTSAQVEKIYKFGQKYSNAVFFGGYAVTPTRPDYGVHIRELYIDLKEYNKNQKLREEAKKLSRNATDVIKEYENKYYFLYWK